MEDFTEDTFKCGICNEENFSIDEYVGHMLEKEECTMVLETSKYLQGMILPRFKRKPLSQYNKNKRNVLPSFAIEVEVSKGITRWKCKACSLTLSREAAVINHYKLSHNDCLPEEKEVVNNKCIEAEAIKTETKENGSDDSDSQSPLDDALSLLSSTPVSALKWDTDDDLALENIKSQGDEPICHICGQVFKSMSIVNSHVKIVHSAKKPFICNVEGCHISFKTKGSLVRHYRRHTGDRPYKCTVCGRAYRESGSLLRHQQSKIPCDQKPDNHLPRYGITLPFLNGFKYDGEMDCKLNLKKESEEEPMIDPPSGDILDLDDSKAKIRKEIDKNGGFTFLSESPSDPSMLEKKPLLLRETKKEDFTPDETQNHIEEMDFKTLDYIKTLEEEEKILRRAFVCPLCHKSYTRATSLSAHLKTHLVELGDQCPTCKKSFTSDHALSRHLSSHSSVRQFECRKCGKGFKLKSHVLNHLKSHSDIKTIPCPDCGALFKSVSSRNSHLKIHKGERNFECAICFRAFIAKASFLRHLKVHTKSSLIKGTAPSTSNIKTEDVTDTKHILEDWSNSSINHVEDGDCDAVETLSDKNYMSENESKLENFLNEKMDLSSMYSEESDLTLSPRDYLIPNFC